jgi:nucleoid-associated protein YgaU
MRKEVKLGMALGGGLVALLIAYLIVAPPSDRKHGVQLVGTDGASIIDPSAQSGGDTGAAEDANKAHAAEVVKAEHVLPQPPAEQPKVTGTLGDKASPAKPTGRDPWNDPLEKGKVEAAGSPAKSNTVIALPTKPQGPAAPVPGDVRKAPERPVSALPERTAEKLPTKVQPPVENRTPGYTMITSPHEALGGGLITAAERAAMLTGPITGNGNAIVKDEPRTVAVPELGSTKAAPVAGSQHVVRSGETFSSIAQAVYGSAAYYPHLIRANPNANPNNLKLGTVLTIPKVEDVKATGPATPVGGVMKVGAADDVKIDPARQHRVAPGDSLYKISLKHYGTPNYLEAIYEKNRQQIGANPTRLKLGMILDLPEKTAVAETTSALGGGTSGGTGEQH